MGPLILAAQVLMNNERPQLTDGMPKLSVSRKHQKDGTNLILVTWKSGKNLPSQFDQPWKEIKAALKTHEIAPDSILEISARLRDYFWSSNVLRSMNQELPNHKLSFVLGEESPKNNALVIKVKARETLFKQMSKL